MKSLTAFAIISTILFGAAQARADQCPPGSGAYCPAGTHCAYGICAYDNPWKAAHSHHKIYPRPQQPQH